MANETSKTRLYFGILEEKVFQGKGIDIGCGKDPIFPNVKCFDLEDGDANKITKYVNEQFDFVFSSHCLEHMKNPFYAIQEWWKLVKDNGYLYFVVPDENLYEQKSFPSKYNLDHKYTFSVLKKHSNTIRSTNLLELISTLDNARLLKLEVQDNNYDYNLKDTDQTLGKATAQICCCIQKNKEYKNIDYKFNKNYFLNKIILLINVLFINIKIILDKLIISIKNFFKKLL